MKAYVQHELYPPRTLCSVLLLGVERDDRAASRYGCQMRERLKEVTGEEVYLRPGPYWYRNVVYGKGERTIKSCLPA